MYDVAIIGAGVIGSAIARELSRYNANICVIEKEEDVCNGTSKANSAIIHAGFDAKPGSLKAKLNVRGNELMDRISKELDIPFKRNGSLVVCTKDQDRNGLDELLEKAEINGVPGCRIVEREELLEMEPNVADDVTCALLAPTGGIVCPFHMTMAFAENANVNGVAFHLNTQVTNIAKSENGYKISVVHTDTNTEEVYEANVVINAAGVYADELNNMVSENKLHITARKGEYCLLDKDAGAHVAHTIFQLPSKMGKGVLVSPTVHGNLLVGPTALDVDDKESLNTTGDGLLSALHLLQVMVDTGKKLSELATVMEVLPQALVGAKVPNHKKDSYMEYPEIAKAIEEVSAKFAGEGRVLIRPSGTEPLVRVMIEGKDQNVIEEEAQKLAELNQNVML